MIPYTRLPLHAGRLLDLDVAGESNGAGLTVLTSGSDGRVVEVELLPQQSGESREVWQAPGSVPVTCLRALASRPEIIAGLADGRVVRLDRLARRDRTDSPLETLYRHSGPVRVLSWDPRREMVYSGDVEGVIVAWDARAREEAWRADWHDRWILDLQLIQVRRKGFLSRRVEIEELVVTSSWDCTISFWDAPTGTLVDFLELPTEEINAMCVVVEDDAPVLYGATLDGAIVEVDPARQKIRQHRQVALDDLVALAASGPYLIGVTFLAGLVCIDRATLQGRPVPGALPARAVESAKYWPDTRQFLLGTGTGELLVTGPIECHRDET